MLNNNALHRNTEVINKAYMKETVSAEDYKPQQLTLIFGLPKLFHECHLWWAISNLNTETWAGLNVDRLTDDSNFIEKKHPLYHWVESLLYSFDLSGSGWCRDVCNQGRHEWKSHEWTFVLKNCNATYYLVLIGKNNHLLALKTYLLLFFALIFER